jgi:hypothetical protein
MTNISETPIISSISGGNLNPIDSNKKSNSDINHEQRKRNFVLNNDRIENLQLHENAINSPSSTTWNKVSEKFIDFYYSIIAIKCVCIVDEKKLISFFNS